MLGLFRRKTVKRIPRDSDPELFHNVWVRKKQPSPGAQAYALESFSLAQFTPIGPAVANRAAIGPKSGPQPYVLKAVTIAGIPTVAGQVFSQALFDPAVGYVNTPMPLVNLPFPKTVDPIGGRLT